LRHLSFNLQVAEAKETEKMIMVARDRYRGVAARGAMLFSLLNSLNKIHAFYQFSLNAFVAVFARGIDNAPFGRKKKSVVITEVGAQPVCYPDYTSWQPRHTFSNFQPTNL
jgi:hypothetical protein